MLWMRILATVFLVLSMLFALIKNIIVYEWFREEGIVNNDGLVILAGLYSLGWRIFVIVAVWVLQ